MKQISQARRDRTRAFTNLRSTIDLCLRQKATLIMPDGLPSWWPFWSDMVFENTVALVRAARRLAPFEGIDLEGGAR